MPKNFNLVSKKFNLVPKKINLLPKKSKLVAKAIKISDEKIQKITNRVDWILSKRVCDVITTRAAIAHEVTWSYGDLSFSSWCHRKKSI